MTHTRYPYIKAFRPADGLGSCSDFLPPASAQQVDIFGTGNHG